MTLAGVFCRWVSCRVLPCYNLLWRFFASVPSTSAARTLQAPYRKCYGGVVSLYLPNPFFFLHTFSRFLCRNGDSVLSCNHLFLIGSFYVDMCVNVRSQSRLFPIGIFETCSSVFGNFLTCFCKFLSVSVLRRLVDCSAPRGRMYFRLCFPKNGRSFAFKSFV